VHVSTFRLVSNANSQILPLLDRGAIVSFVKPALYLATLLLIIFFLETLMNHLYQRGQGLVEYAMIMVLVAIIVIIILALFGSAVGNMFSSVIAMF